MQRALGAIGLMTVLPGLLPAQAPVALPVFDVADVHASASGARPFVDAGFLPNGRYQLRNATMVDLIKTAWSVDAENVFGGPNWLDSDRFDVVAKATPSSSYPDRARMLRSLLAERFKLVVHKDEKPVTVFALTVGKRGAQLKESADSGESGCKPGFEPGPPVLFKVTCLNVSMAEFGRRIRLNSTGYLDHQVVDLTGLKGAYDLNLKWTPRGTPRPANAGADLPADISLFEALDKQLGLKLAVVKRPMPVIVVDSVNRMPTENTPSVTKSLVPETTEFEVATIKPNNSGSRMHRFEPKPGGRIEVENIPLKMLISVAWDIDQSWIVGAPKWVSTDAFDVIAKAPLLQGGASPPFDTVRAMLRGLLAERFKLTVHNENQPVPVWTLVVGKRGLKLQEADPSARSSCKKGAGETGAVKSGSSVITYGYTCQNTTMAQFAEAMPAIAPGYVDRPAVDMTGLNGAYDFAIKWTPRNLIDSGGRGGNAETAPEPTGGMTFFEAVEKLGLRLESGQKHPMPVLVVDHIEQLGPDN